MLEVGWWGSLRDLSKNSLEQGVGKGTYQDFTLCFDCTIIVTSQLLMALYFKKQCKFLNSFVLEIILIDKVLFFDLTGYHFTVI